MPIDELSAYHRALRKYEYESGKKLTGIQFRKRIYWFIRLVLKADEMIAHEKIVVLNDRCNRIGNTPKIFACTHIGGNDIQRALQVIRTPAYLMLGDPGILYKDPIWQGMKLNGVIPLDNDQMEDRHIAYFRSVELLQNGGNLLIFPEGSWNATPNLPVMKIFTGTVRMAMETGAEIVPMAVGQYGRTFYFNIGENYTISHDAPESVNELTQDLRDKLVTLKWDILCSQPIQKRTDWPDSYSEKLKQYQNEILGKCTYDTGLSMKDLERERFHDKTVTEPDEAFAFMDKLMPSLNNAFLFRKER